MGDFLMGLWCGLCFCCGWCVVAKSRMGFDTSLGYCLVMVEV